MIDTTTIRKKIMSLAIQGKLTSRKDEDSSTEALFCSLQDKRGKKAKKYNQVSDTDKLFAIPNNWKWVRLGSISETISKGTTPRGGKVAYLESGIGFLRAENLAGYDKLDLSNEKYISEETHNGFLKRSVLEEGDILISIAGTLGRTALVRAEDLPLNSNQAVAFVRISDKSLVDLKYFTYALNAPEIQKSLGNRKVEMAIPNLSLDVIANCVVPLPPFEEQKRIVSILDAVFEKLETIDDFQEQYINNITILKEKVFDAGIQGKLTQQLSDDGCAEELFEAIQNERTNLINNKKIRKEKDLSPISDDEIPFHLPHNWKWVRLGDICSKISSGNTPAGGAKGGAYVDEGYCFFREQNIYNDGIHEEGMVYISEELLNARPNSTVLPNDILLNITGGSIGRCALVPEDFTRGSINQHILIIRTVDPRIRFYVLKCLCSPYYQKLIMGNVVGDKDGFSAGRCKNTLIPLPPIKEQERIVERIDSLLSAIG